MELPCEDLHRTGANAPFWTLMETSARHVPACTIRSGRQVSILRANRSGVIGIATECDTICCAGKVNTSDA